MQDSNAICLTGQRYKSGDTTRVGNLFFGNTVGTVEFSPRDFEGTAMEHVGSLRKVYVADLAIREDARRIGLATRMLQHVEDYCSQHGYEEIYLHVDVSNDIARKLYAKLGYVELSQNDPNVQAFTEHRLQKSACGFILLRKTVPQQASSISSNSFTNTQSYGQSPALSIAFTSSPPSITSCDFLPPSIASDVLYHCFKHQQRFDDLPNSYSI
jgi:hypothetical protein